MKSLCLPREGMPGHCGVPGCLCCVASPWVWVAELGLESGAKD
jgi:hypothetical protein